MSKHINLDQINGIQSTSIVDSTTIGNTNVKLNLISTISSTNASGVRSIFEVVKTDTTVKTSAKPSGSLKEKRTTDTVSIPCNNLKTAVEAYNEIVDHLIQMEDMEKEKAKAYQGNHTI